MYPVGLGEEGGVAETHPQAQENPPEGTHAHVRRGDHQECDGVAQEDSRQQHVAHLASRGSHDGRVVVAHEGDDDEGGGDDAQHGDEDGEDGPRRVPLQLDDGNGNAAGAVDVGPHLVRTQLTGELGRLGETRVRQPDKVSSKNVSTAVLSTERLRLCYFPTLVNLLMIHKNTHLHLVGLFMLPCCFPFR